MSSITSIVSLTNQPEAKQQNASPFGEAFPIQLKLNLWVKRLQLNRLRELTEPQGWTQQQLGLCIHDSLARRSNQTAISTIAEAMVVSSMRFQSVLITGSPTRAKAATIQMVTPTTAAA